MSCIKNSTTTEKDMSRLRFLCTRVKKGETLLSEDIDFLITKQAELYDVCTAIMDCLDTLRMREENR